MKKYSFSWLAALIVWVVSTTPPGRAAMITGQKQGNGPVNSPDNMFQVTLMPQTVSALEAPTKMDMALLTAFTKNENANWTFNVANAAAGGTFNVLQYTPFALNTLGGADFTVLYNDGTGKARTDYDWLQFAYPSNWGQFGSKPFIDGAFKGVPFYSNYTPLKLPTLKTPTSYYGPSIWLNKTGDYPQQKIQNPTGGGKVPAGDLILEDEPNVPYTSVPKNGSSSITFDDFLVTFANFNGKAGTNSGGTVTIYDGLQWGVKVSPVSAPEPASLTLSLIGCAALMAVRWRCRHSASSSYGSYTHTR